MEIHGKAGPGAVPAAAGETVGPNGKRKKVIGVVLALAIVGGAGIAYYYHYQGAHYVTTEDARVAADLVVVTPQAAGKLTAWHVAEGDRVEVGQVIGTVDPGVGAGASAGGGLPGAMPGTSLGKDPLAVAADRANVRAPAAGVVIRSTAVPGATVAPGQALAYLVDPGQVYITANIEETRIRRVRPGQRVDVRVDAYPGVVLRGRVRSVGLATTSTFALLPAQNVSGNFTKVTQRIPVKIDVMPVPGVRLLPGLNATVTIHVGSEGVAAR